MAVGNSASSRRRRLLALERGDRPRRGARGARTYFRYGILPDSLAGRNGRGLRLRLVAAARSKQTADLRFVVGNRSDPGIRISAVSEHIWRPAALVESIDRVVHSPVVPELHQIPGVAAVYLDDGRPRDCGAGDFRPASRPLGSADHYLWPGAAVFLFPAHPAHSRQCRAARLCAVWLVARSEEW